MTKKILLATSVVALLFAGCTGKDTEPKELTKKAVDAKKEVAKKVGDTKKEVIESVKKSGPVAKNVKVEPVLPESSMKDDVKEEVIESVK